MSAPEPVTSATHAPTCPQSIPYEVGSGAPYGCTCRGSEPTARWIQWVKQPGHYIGPFATQEEAEAYMEGRSMSMDEYLDYHEPQVSDASEPKNQYRPWEAMGITELAYFKQRYVEVLLEMERMRKALEEIATTTPWDYPALRHIAEMRDRARRALDGEQP